MYLSELATGKQAVITNVRGKGSFRKRIIEMGFIKGATVECVFNAPLKDPIDYRIMDYDVSMRRSEAALVEIVPLDVADNAADNAARFYGTMESNDRQEQQGSEERTIRVALTGNPNSGKTTFFNMASGAHEHVGNYSGVTVDAKEGRFKYKGYTFRLVDLPGTYSLSAYTPEELFVRKELLEAKPDVVLNVVAASNLERNLYLTTQLIDMNTCVVMALNMYDELEKNGSRLECEQLGMLLNIPIVPTVARKGHGISEVFDAIIRRYEQNEKSVPRRSILINHGPVIESAIEKISSLLSKNKNINPVRFFAIKLLENDRDVEAQLAGYANSATILEMRDKAAKEICTMLNEDAETAVVDAKYGFIAGALRETYQPNRDERVSVTSTIDTFVTHKLVGYPIFLFFMWLMFLTTFSLGEYPKGWIEWLISQLGNWVANLMPDGSLKDLLIDGIIGGVGGVIVFLPNILILYFFISFMEDSGYMARAAFIMDKIMHKMGLHGKSFIPLVMGFGCNVPAVMASRTIESRSSRMATMLVIPLMSCSARLPVYLLLVGAFFPEHGSIVLLSIYLIGIVMSVIFARIFRKYLFRDEDIPFVMELPPYRLPTFKSTIRHMWDKGEQYLKKMGKIILLASIVIWFLGYYPKNVAYSQDYEKLTADVEYQFELQLAAAETKKHDTLLKAKNEALQLIANKQHTEHQQKSYIGQLGRFIEPVIKPLGFDWKIGIGILTGIGAKEIVVSTLNVLYTDFGNNAGKNLEERMRLDIDEAGNPVFSCLTAFCMMLFILFYFPCIAAITAIKNESGSWKWGLFTVFYTTALAWITTFAVYQIGSL
ncbi:MAG: ferrous iron transport protein B [Bacteroidales bacterium]|jgi:ferrous iron transport protein B|nr:ferrous iron transport protein B [Bacteroidales bacterium]